MSAKFLFRINRLQAALKKKKKIRESREKKEKKKKKARPAGFEPATAHYTQCINRTRYAAICVTLGSNDAYIHIRLLDA